MLCWLDALRAGPNHAPSALSPRPGPEHTHLRPLPPRAHVWQLEKARLDLEAKELKKANKAIDYNLRHVKTKTDVRKDVARFTPSFSFAPQGVLGARAWTRRA